MFYTNILQNKDNICFRGYKDGKKITQKIKYEPSIFIPNESGDFSSLHGVRLERKRFSSISEFKDFHGLVSKLDNFQSYGSNNMTRQFLNDYFDGEIEYDLNVMNIMSLDIETTTKYGKIDTVNTPEEITLITVKNFITKQITTFGCWDFEYNEDKIKGILTKQGSSLDLTRLSKFTYVKCSNETDLLERFMSFFTNDYPDIITGYNVLGFDIVYLVNRIRHLFSDNEAKRLSPFKILKDREEIINSYKKINVVDLEGIQVLDYLHLYKKFSGTKLENYKLDTVAKEELGREKLSHEYSSFREFYEKDPYAFTLYNIIDVDLIDELEEKLQLILLVMGVAYESKTNYIDVFSTIRTWESLLYNVLLEKSIVPPIKISEYSQGDEDDDQLYEYDEDISYFYDTEEETKKEGRIIGGYVKDIDPCRKDWVVGFDATSLYPSIIMSFNMSSETLVDDPTTLIPASEENIMKLVNREIDLSYIKDKDYSHAANGQCFTKERRGLFPEVVEGLFDKRQIAKKSMLKLESEHSDDIKKITSLNIKQNTYKILINAFFGACANKHFTYFDNRIAEGITMTGQVIIRNAMKNMNSFLSKILKKQDEYCYYCDTDSLHISLNDIVKEYYTENTDREVSHILHDVCKDLLTPEITKISLDLNNYLNAYRKDKIIFKREFIASRGIYTAKKRYCLNVFNSEGVEYDPPKLKIMGLEIVKTSTPMVARKALKDLVNLLLTKTNDDLIEYVEEFKNTWNSIPYQNISIPTSLNNLLKYTDSGTIYTKGTPMHVKASLIYNHYIEEMNLLDRYTKIEDGDKVKFVLIKSPNQFNNKAMAFNTMIPDEFELSDMIDYDAMYHRAFLSPLLKLTNAMGWDVERKVSLDDLWS